MYKKIQKVKKLYKKNILLHTVKQQCLKRNRVVSHFFLFCFLLTVFRFKKRHRGIRESQYIFDKNTGISKQVFEAKTKISLDTLQNLIPLDILFKKIYVYIYVCTRHYYTYLLVSVKNISDNSLSSFRYRYS